MLTGPSEIFQVGIQFYLSVPTYHIILCINSETR